MFVPRSIVRKNFAAISTKIYEKPTRTGFRLAGPRDNPTTGGLGDRVYHGNILATEGEPEQTVGMSAYGTLTLLPQTADNW